MTPTPSPAAIDRAARAAFAFHAMRCQIKRPWYDLPVSRRAYWLALAEAALLAAQETQR